MARSRAAVDRRWIARAWLIGAACAGGCGERRASIESMVVPHSTLGAVTIAVAPAVNLSGSTDFDPNRFADLMAGELMHAHRVPVIPVSRVLAALAAQGADRVRSPEHASEIAALVGADSILVFAVTEYNPYEPPRVALSLQLYAAVPRVEDAGGLAEGSRAFHGPRGVPASGLLAQVQRRFDASHADVLEDLKRYARERSADDSPYGWRKFIVSQQHYVQYCCYAAVRGLLDGEGWVGQAKADPWD